MFSVKELYIYPIKSAAGIALTEAEVTRRGFAYDRRWMLIDDKGTFLSQRSVPRLALIKPRLTDTHLLVSAPGCEELSIPLASPGLARRQVTVWKDEMTAEVLPETVHAWFTNFLGRPCSLVYMPDDSERQVNLKYAKPHDIVGFADGYPFLLIGEGSLAELNGRLATAVSMTRFRPNIVVAGTVAFAEDSWAGFRIGATEFRTAKPCSRCVLINVDPLTGKPGREPLATLAKYRRQEKGVMFGQNLVHAGGGTIRVGDALEGVRFVTKENVDA